ncbi:cupredoxin domain-containing protein [Actinospongicola halichondriae]|uniref:cupredoxin domain-containing protein n=1 Tax=Actinospongicola halichondriae TaxID=3236844 RepID=UPI003D53F074
MRTSLRRTAIIGLALGLTFGAAACGDDDGEAVRELGDGGSGSGAASGSGTASGSGVAAADKECAPVGEDLEADADTTVDLQLADYEFVPDDVEVEAGTVTFAAENIGEEAHELAFIPGGGDVPLNADGDPDEDALADMGAFELEAFGPGQTCNATYELEAGDYTLFCIVENADGETHASLGMTGLLTVG